MYVLSSVVVFSMTRVHSTKMTLMGQLVIYNTTDSMRLDALKICLFEFYYYYSGESCKTAVNQFKVGFFLALDRQFRPYGLTSR